jgi:heavy metal sensor kinase
MDRLSTRLALAFTFLSAALLAVLGVGVLLWSQESMEKDLRQALEREAGEMRQWIVRDLESGPKDFPPGLAEDLTQGLAATGSRGQLQAPNGTTLYASPGPLPPSGEVLEHVLTFDIGSRGVYRLAVTHDTAPVRERLKELGVFVAALIPVAAVAAGLLAWVVLRRTLAPIDAVRLEAEQISRTNVSHRIEERWTSGEVRDLVRTFNAMLGRMEAAFEDLNSFAADAAHELRTPLATLRAEIETAIQRSPTLEEYEEILKSFQEEVSRMNRVVTDLFMLARMDRGQHVLEMERTRLGPLIEETVETWDPVGRARGIRIRTEGGDAEVRGNAVALRRVLMNLVENAVKYNRDGGEVVVTLERRGGRVVLQVRDTGIGIAPEHLGKLFQRFFRADRARSRESGGAGLGLAICKSFVLSHGGTISVASTPGVGSTFTVDLPLDEGPGRDRAAGNGPSAHVDGSRSERTSVAIPGDRR